MGKRERKMERTSSGRYLSACGLVLPFLLAKGAWCAPACTIDQVEAGSVTPLTTTVGSVLEVSTVAELKAAIIEANQNGDTTILLHDGEYEVASTSSYPYLTGDNIVIRSYSGDRDAVIWKGGGMRDAGGTENGIGVDGDNIIIADITIAEVGNHGIMTTATGGNNLLVHNVHFSDTYEQMLKGASDGTSTGGADNVEVSCSLFDYSAGEGPQYYIGGIDSHTGQDWHVHDNVFKYIASPESGNLAEHAIHFWDDSKNNTIERNKIVDCDRGIGLGLESTDSYSGGLVANNMITNTGTLNEDVGIGLETAADVEVYNNTIYLASYSNAIEYRFSTSTGSIISNNLTNQAITSRNGATADVQNNLETAESDWFVDVDSGNLHLASALTEVEDQGLSLSSITDDIDKNSRPQGNGYDIGADEYYRGTPAPSVSGDFFYPLILPALTAGREK